MAYCGEHTLVNEKRSEWVAVSLKCRSWLCDECHNDRRRQLIATAFAGKPNRFITLTVNPSYGVGPLARAYELSRSWRNIVKGLKRKYPGKSLQYLAVFEAQKSGEPHLHIVFRGPWVDQQWLSDQMKARMNAPIVDVRYVNNKARVAGYIAKYIGKGTKKFGNLKRYWQSKMYDLREPLGGLNKDGEPDNWQVWKFTLKECIGIWTGQGYKIEFDGRLAVKDEKERRERMGDGGYDPPGRFEADVKLWEKFFAWKK